MPPSIPHSSWAQSSFLDGLPETNALISKDQFNILRHLTHGNNETLAVATPKHLSLRALLLCFVFAFISDNLLFLNWNSC